MTRNNENLQNNENLLVNDKLKEIEKNPVSENESEKATQNISVLKNVVAGTVGVATGGAGLMAAMSFKEPDEPIQDPKLESLPEYFIEPASESALELELESENFDGSQVLVAHKVSDDMSFNQAFATARQEVGSGGVFKWHGNVYGTYYSNEWQGFSDEYQQAFSRYQYNIETEPQLAEILQFTDEPLFSEEQQFFEEPQSAEADIIDQENFYPVDVIDYNNLAEIKVVSENDDDVFIINSESFKLSENEFNILNAKFDGNNAALLDINGDGDYDIKVIDDNSEFDYSSFHEVEVNNANIEEIHELIVAPFVDNSFDYNIDENDFMSDFNNNADISNFI